MIEHKRWSPEAERQPDVRVVRIADIKIGERVRKNMGDLDELAKSIAEVGLLQFPVVGPDLGLIAGERRIRACQQLGWTELPVYVTESLDDVAARARAEQDENRCREDLTPSERVAMARKLTAALTSEATQRKATTQFQSGGRRLVRTPSRDKSPGRTVRVNYPHRARDEVAKIVGTGERTLLKATTVVEAESDPDPEVRRVATKARQEMDRTGRVDPAHRKVTQAKNHGPAKTKPAAVKPKPKKDGQRQRPPVETVTLGPQSQSALSSPPSSVEEVLAFVASIKTRVGQIDVGTIGPVPQVLLSKLDEVCRAGQTALGQLVSDLRQAAVAATGEIPPKPDRPRGHPPGCSCYNGCYQVDDWERKYGGDVRVTL
jgi:ParB family chromosome partitioning protein